MPSFFRIAALAVGVSSLLGTAALAYPKEPIHALRMPPQRLSIRWVPVGRNAPSEKIAGFGVPRTGSSLSVKVANLEDMPRGGGIKEATKQLVAFNQSAEDPIIRNGTQVH